MDDDLTAMTREQLLASRSGSAPRWPSLPGPSSCADACDTGNRSIASVRTLPSGTVPMTDAGADRPVAVAVGPNRGRVTG
jgi:hypothetical protein